MNFDSAALNLLNMYTPERLTEILYKSQLLLSGRVLKARKRVEEITLVSNIVRIELTFSPDASCAISELFLKVSRTDIAQIDNTREMLFYKDIAQQMKKPPTPLFLEAFYHEQQKISCILLVDLRRTHFNLQLNYPLMPSFKQCSGVVEKLAEFHAYWWDHPLLHKQQFKHDKDKSLNTDNLFTLYEAFSKSMNEWFSGTLKDVYSRILSNLELIFAKGDKNTTITHGDAHLGNVLYPHSENDEVVFIDWSDWNAGKALDDLAYMIALGYFPEQKKNIELALIKLHNRIINEKGIVYSLEESINDYKMAVIGCMFIPIFQWHHKIPANIWFYNFERINSSFKDLKCIELLS